jgi:hypothetical protein
VAREDGNEVGNWSLAGGGMTGANVFGLAIAKYYGLV